MVIIEIFVYVCIASMMIVCVKYVNKSGFAQKSDRIYFWVMFILILTQVFIQFLPSVRNNTPHFLTQICLGMIVALALMYVLTRTTDASFDVQKRVRAWTGWAMFFTTEFCICALLVGFPETRTDLYRMPLPVALCIGMLYYPPVLDRIARVKDANEKRTAEENIEEHKKAIINLAIESWRFARTYERVVTRLNTQQTQRYTRQLEQFIQKAEESLEEVDLRVVNVEGYPYDPGMAATPLNIEDFEPEDQLIVDKMLEPIIMEGTVLAKTGTVTLRRVE